jgi:hypothetical protein
MVALEAPAFAFGEAAPDAEPFVAVEGPVEAFGLHGAGAADGLGFAGGAALLGVERFGVGGGADGVGDPGRWFGESVEWVVSGRGVEGEVDGSVVGVAGDHQQATSP